MPIRHCSIALAWLTALASCAGLVAAAEPLQAAQAGAAPVSVDPPLVNLGLLRPGQSGSASIKLTNTGPAPLRILKSITSCACTAVDLADTTILPGQSVQFSGSMTPKAGLGEKMEKITIFFEGFDPLRINVTAEVSLPIRIKPPHLDATEGISGVVDVESQDGRTFRILATAGGAPSFVDFDPQSDAPRNHYQLRWDLSRYDQKTMPGWWVIETDHAEAPIVDARVHHEWTKVQRQPTRPWVPSDQRLVVGCLKPGQSTEVTTRLQYPRSSPQRPTDPVPATKLASLVSDSPQFTIELVRTELSEQEKQNDLLCTLRVTTKPGKPGLIYGPARFTTPDGFGDTWTIIGRLDDGQATHGAGATSASPTTPPGPTGNRTPVDP